MWTDDCEDTLAVAQGFWPHTGWGLSLWGCLGAYLPSPLLRKGDDAPGVPPGTQHPSSPGLVL